uniref:GST C-terminal domain-containing protein n=1 Tax=Haptolina brevifila TaxID=156173 RepID=A0A7S2BQ67_9EUKA
MGAALDANLGRMPVLDCPEGTIGQSAAINYYVAAECGMLGASTFEAAQIMSFAEHIKELRSAYTSLVPYGTEPSKEAIKTFFESKEATDYTGPADGSKRSSRMLLWFMGRMERLLGDDGFAVGGKMSLADVLLYNTFADTLVSDSDMPAHRKEPFGSLKKVDAALKKHPKLTACIASVAAHPAVKEWLKTRNERPYKF